MHIELALVPHAVSYFDLSYDVYCHCSLVQPSSPILVPCLKPCSIFYFQTSKLIPAILYPLNHDIVVTTRLPTCVSYLILSFELLYHSRYYLLQILQYVQRHVLFIWHRELYQNQSSLRTSLRQTLCQSHKSIVITTPLRTPNGIDNHQFKRASYVYYAGLYFINCEI